MDYGYGYNKTYVDFINKVETNSKPTKVIVDIEGNNDQNDKVFLYKKETPIGDEFITLRLALGDDFKTMFYLLKMSFFNDSITFEFQDGFDADDPDKNIVDLIKNLNDDLDQTINVATNLGSLDNNFAINTINEIKTAINI